MNVTTLVLNAAGDPHFQSTDQFNIKELIRIAKASEQNARDKGAEWTAGAISFFGSEVVRAVNTGENKDVTQAIIQMLMAAWTFDSLYGGLTADDYLKSDMEFTITTNGVVVHSRVPAKNKVH